MTSDQDREIEWEDVMAEPWMEGAWTDPGPLAAQPLNSAQGYYLGSGIWLLIGCTCAAQLNPALTLGAESCPVHGERL